MHKKVITIFIICFFLFIGIVDAEAQANVLLKLQDIITVEDIGEAIVSIKIGDNVFNRYIKENEVLQRFRKSSGQTTEKLYPINQ